MDEGKQLKIKLAEIDKTREEIASILGLTRNTLYNYTKQAKLDEDFKIQLFEKFKIQLDTNVITNESKLEEKVRRLEQEMSEMKSHLLRLLNKPL